MATTTNTKITVTASGDGIESAWEPTEMENSRGVGGGPVKQLLATGPNNLSVPTGAMGFVLVPPAASSAVLKLKGDGVETGFALRTGQPAAIPLPTGTASVHIDSSEQEIVYLHWT